MTNIEFIECEYNFMDHKMHDFFCDNQETDKFLIRYVFLLNKEQKPRYGILETHRDAMNHGVCTVNGDFTYHYGEHFIITGYCPIKINS